jgi:hypothetical protein
LHADNTFFECGKCFAAADANDERIVDGGGFFDSGVIRKKRIVSNARLLTTNC